MNAFIHIIVASTRQREVMEARSALTRRMYKVVYVGDKIGANTSDCQTTFRSNATPPLPGN